MEEEKKKTYLFVNKMTGSLELRDFPYPEREGELLARIYGEYALNLWITIPWS